MSSSQVYSVWSSSAKPLITVESSSRFSSARRTSSVVTESSPAVTTQRYKNGAASSRALNPVKPVSVSVLSVSPSRSSQAASRASSSLYSAESSSRCHRYVSSASSAAPASTGNSASPAVIGASLGWVLIVTSVSSPASSSGSASITSQPSRISPQTEHFFPLAVPGLPTSAGTSSTSSGLWPAGSVTVSRLSSSPQTEQ